jgi:hypothetical protein
LDKAKHGNQVNVVISGIEKPGVVIDGKTETDAD